jgi:hypothetical protein
LSQSLHDLQHGFHLILFMVNVFLGLYDLIQDGVVAYERVGEQNRFLVVHCPKSVSEGTKGVGTKSHSVSSWQKSGKHDLHAPQRSPLLRIKENCMV